MVAYETRLSLDPVWALSEGSRHFEDRSAVHDALREVARRLEALGIPYAVAGGMALFRHGYRRFTEDIDILVSRDGLDAIHKHLEGRGYVPLFAGSRTLRDAAHGVRIEFIISGDFPGDGKPKPVVFPAPDAAAIDLGGIRYVSLPTLIELKLASGMTNPGRLRDLSDVLELIRVLGLPASFADQLDPYVRDKFRELWDASRT